jgi:Yip1 domain
VVWSKNNSQFQQLTPADQESRIEIATKIASKIVYAEMIIFPFLALLFFAGLFWIIFNLLVGGKFNFVTSMGIVSHALVPTIIGSLLGILILFLKDPSTVDLQHLVASNAGAFLPDGSSKALATFLRFVDVFLIWEMILLAMGFHAAAPKKISFGAAFAWVFALWLVAALATTGLVAAFT